MEKHIKLVGILNIVYRSLTLLGALVLIGLAIGFRFIIEFVQQFEHHNMQEIPPVVFTIVPVVLTCIGIIMIIVSVAGIIGGVGVLKRKEWGRITTLIISFLNLLRVPLGTALGIYSLWALLNDEVIKKFETSSGKKK